MGSSSTTTTTKPPSYARPYIEQGLRETQDQYNQDQAAYQPFEYARTDGLRGINTLANNNQLSQAASGLATNTLSGGFLGSNPYLDATFNRAAQATQGQLSSQFAGAGRNVDQSEGNRAQQLNDLANQIYGGNYQAERDRQQSTLLNSGQLSQNQYADYNQLLGVGNQAGQSLDDYLNRVNAGSFGNSVQTSGGGNNWAAGLGLLSGLFSLSDKRMKTDIKKVGKQEGLNVYEFRYKGGDAKHRGFMAQEVEKKYPLAVAEDDSGTKYVNYSAIGRTGFMGSVA